MGSVIDGESEWGSDSSAGDAKLGLADELLLHCGDAGDGGCDSNCDCDCGDDDGNGGCDCDCDDDDGNGEDSDLASRRTHARIQSWTRTVKQQKESCEQDRTNNCK